jgi:hypothetical protein
MILQWTHHCHPKPIRFTFGVGHCLDIMTCTHHYSIMQFLCVCCRGGKGHWTQGLALARQMLYHLSLAPSPFCFGYFWGRVLHLFPGLAWITILLFMLTSQLRWQAAAPRPAFICWNGVLWTFLAQAARYLSLYWLGQRVWEPSEGGSWRFGIWIGYFEFK